MGVQTSGGQKQTGIPSGGGAETAIAKAAPDTTAPAAAAAARLRSVARVEEGVKPSS